MAPNSIVSGNPSSKDAYLVWLKNIPGYSVALGSSPALIAWIGCSSEMWAAGYTVLLLHLPHVMQRLKGPTTRCWSHHLLTIRSLLNPGHGTKLAEFSLSVSALILERQCLISVCVLLKDQKDESFSENTLSRQLFFCSILWKKMPHFVKVIHIHTQERILQQFINLNFLWPF